MYHLLKNIPLSRKVAYLKKEIGLVFGFGVCVLDSFLWYICTASVGHPRLFLLSMLYLLIFPLPCFALQCKIFCFERSDTNVFCYLEFGYTA